MNIFIILIVAIIVIFTVKSCKEDSISPLEIIIITGIPAIIIIIIFSMYSFAYRKLADFFTQTEFLEIIESLVLSLVFSVIAVECLKIAVIIAQASDCCLNILVAITITLIILNKLRKTDDGTGIVFYIYDTVMIKIATFISYVIEGIF